MNFIVMCCARIRSLCIVLFRRKQVEDDLQQELTLHVDMIVDQKIAEGMSPREARRRALLEFGGVDRTAEQVRSVWFGMWIERVGREMRLCVRSFIHDPVFAGVAVLTLGLGVAASTSVFTVISSAVLRPLPVSAPDRLAHLFLGDRRFWSHPLWEEIQRRSGQFDGAFASSRTNFDVAVSGESRFVEGLWASGGFFDALGVQALLGRVFTEADDRRGCGVAGPVVVISHRMWQEHFGGDAGVIGRPLPLNRVAFTVIGVTPIEFFGPTVGRTFDALVPLGCEALVRGDGSQLDNPWNTWLNVTLRLRPEQSFAEATTVMQTWQPAIREATRLPRMGQGYLREPMALLPAGVGGASTLWQRYRTSLLALLAIAGLLLMVTCANVANLMLARGVARRREIATRLALGAMPSQVARLVLLEGALVSAAGGVVGLTISRWVTGLLVLGLSQRAGETFVEVAPDWRIAAFTLGVSAGATLLFGAGPAIRSGRVAPRAVLAEHGRLAHSSGRVALDRAILVVQVAVSLVLVVTAGLFMRTFTTLAGLHAGVDRDRVLLVTPHAFGEAAATSGADRLRRYERIRAAVRGIPGVSYAAVSFPTPLSPNMWRTGLDVADAPRLAEEQREIMSTMVSPDWFATYGVPVMRGRDFRAADMTGTRPVAIVNEAFVDRFMADDPDPLGRTFGLWHDRERRYVIVGVVGNVAYASLRDPIGPAVYVPLGRGGELTPIVGSSSIYTALSGIWVVGVRAERGSPAALTGSVVATIREVDPTLTSEARSLAAQVEGTLRQERLTAIVAGLFGGLALLLASGGLYGVTLLTMRRRRAEIGIRMALGATRGRVLGGAILRVGLLVGAGVAIGGLGSLVVGRSLGTLLYGLEPRDPATLIVAAGVLMLAGVGAGLAAAVPAVRVEPSQLLRQQ